jgi:hypothetical protein
MFDDYQCHFWLVSDWGSLDHKSHRCLKHALATNPSYFSFNRFYAQENTIYCHGKAVSRSEHVRTFGHPLDKLKCACGQAAFRPLFAV